MDQCMTEQDRIIEHQKKCFSQLVTLVDGVNEDVSKLLGDIESAMSMFNLPQEIEVFLNY